MNNINFKEFLKTYTQISNEFIDEYYKFFDLCEKDTYGIDAELVIDYLGFTNSDSFYERLRNNYILRSDYIIKRKIQKLQKNKTDIKYYLSFDCFEDICMLSRTKKGQVVREYLLSLRKFLNYYKTHFANNINKLAKSKKYVYIILVDKNKNIQKFGRTFNIQKKLHSYASGKEKHPDIKYILIVDEAKGVEELSKIFINKYKFKNKRELYKIDFDVLKSLVFNSAEMKQYMIEKMDEYAKYDSYVVYDEYEENEYLDIDNNIIGYEKIPKTIKIKKSSKTSKKYKKYKISKGSKRSKKSKSYKKYKN